MSEEAGVITLPMPMRLGSVNCYLLRGGGGFVLVDTGPSSARAQFGRELGRLGCAAGSLRLIALTHGDFDHTGNAVYARDAYGGVLAMHTDDAGMAELGDMFVNRKPPHPVLRALLPMLTGFGASERFIPDVLLSAGDSLAAYGLDAQVISVPGHSRGSIAILTGDGSLFCGDALENIKAPAAGSIVDDAVAAAATVARLKLSGAEMVYPGHGKPFALRELVGSAG